MSIQVFRGSAVLCLAALVSACSSSGAADAGREAECVRDRSSCIYEGSYEPGERDYAEQEAQRLNRAQVKRMRRW